MTCLLTRTAVSAHEPFHHSQPAGPAGWRTRSHRPLSPCASPFLTAFHCPFPSQRTREIGIRMALGAQHQTLTGMFVRHGLALTGIGVACGLAVAIVAMRLMSSLLFKVSPVDPLAYGAASLGLVATPFLAHYFPPRPASPRDPLQG